MDPIIIVGAGLAGYTVARELRKTDPHTPLLIVTADEGDFYAKPMLSNALAQGKQADQLVTTPAAQISAQLGATLLARTQVQRINTGAREILTSSGMRNYSRLVLALGADVIRLPIAGTAAEKIESVNSLDDYRRFRARLHHGSRVVIIGAGLIGCEFANDLAGAGHQVAVIDPAVTPLASLLPAQAGAQLHAALARVGVSWHLQDVVRSVDDAAGAMKVTLASGQVIEADLVLSAVGLRPRIDLAAQAGLKVNRGIVVDDHLRTSDPNIFALGDCAEIDGQVRPYVLPIMNAARAIGATLAQRPTAVVFPPMPVAIKTPALPIVVQPAARDQVGVWRTTASDTGLQLEYLDGEDQLHGFVLTGALTAQRSRFVKALQQAPQAAGLPSV